jgi:uncharacterized membrane protein (UPF0127 family)
LPPSSSAPSFRSVKHLCALAFVWCGAACSTGHGPTQVTPPGDTTTAVSFPGGTITAKIAATFAARTAGLMNVTTLGANSGMLFVFDTNHTPANCAFWMSDTPLPLSIAFIDSTMKVINIDEMAAETTTYHEPTSACRYALEANQGWFTAHGVTAGTIVTFSLPAGTIIDP